MKTLADFKRYLKVGSRLIMTYHSIPNPNHPLPWTREVKSVHTDSVELVDPEDGSRRSSWLYFPKSNLIEFTDNNEVNIYWNKIDKDAVGMPETKERGDLCLTYKLEASQ